MRRVYAYAESGDDLPLELEMAWRIEDMGAAAVLGADAGARLIRRIALAGNVYRAFVSRDSFRDSSGASNWAEWAQRNPQANRLLLAAMGDDDG